MPPALLPHPASTHTPPQASLPEHRIVESKPDSQLDDLRWGVCHVCVWGGGRRVCVGGEGGVYVEGCDERACAREGLCSVGGGREAGRGGVRVQGSDGALLGS